MSNKLIRSLLEKSLKDWAASRMPPLRIAYQDVAFTPGQDETYLRCFVMPANTGSDDLAGVHRVYRGVWQVSIVKPKGGGLGAAGGIEVELSDLYLNNLLIKSGSFELFIRSPMSAAAPIGDEVNTTIPVSCQYRADTI